MKIEKNQIYAMQTKKLDAKYFFLISKKNKNTTNTN